MQNDKLISHLVNITDATERKRELWNTWNSEFIGNYCTDRKILHRRWTQLYLITSSHFDKAIYTHQWRASGTRSFRWISVETSSFGYRHTANVWCRRHGSLLCPNYQFNFTQHAPVKNAYELAKKKIKQLGEYSQNNRTICCLLADLWNIGG